MRVPIIMPQLGESIAEATVVTIAVKVGDRVTADQEIIEVETNKALLQVTTPCAGEITELLVEPKETYEVGATLGYVEAVPEEVARVGTAPANDSEPEPAPMLDVEPGQFAPMAQNGNGQHTDAPPVPTLSAELATDDVAEPVVATKHPTVRSTPGSGTGGGLPVPAGLSGTGYFSPRLKARLTELGLQAADLSGLAGTGAGGRVTVTDLEKFLAELEGRSPQPAGAMRVAVGDAMRRSWSRPLATVGRSVCMDPILAHRKGQADPKPGIVLYAIRALALALAEDLTPAGRLIGKRIVPASESVDIGFAVEVDGGLLVPVLRGANRRSLAELNASYHDLVAAARRRQVPPDAIGNAAASVTNFGTCGLEWATPIPLPDESIMLGLGSGRRVPSWDEAKGAFVPVTEAEITLSLDHRMLDGGSAGRLLARVERLMVEPAKL